MAGGRSGNDTVGGVKWRGVWCGVWCDVGLCGVIVGGDKWRGVWCVVWCGVEQWSGQEDRCTDAD